MTRDTAFGEGDFAAGCRVSRPRRWPRTRRWSTASPASPRTRGATPAQIALAPILAQPWIVAPIPATTKRHRLEGESGSRVVMLTPEDLAGIAGALAEIDIEGERYPAPLMQVVGR